MDLDLWIREPETAFREWQNAEAVGADRRAFAEQSITQHCSMFSRFNQYLVSRHATLATFGTDHIDGFSSRGSVTIASLARQHVCDTSS
jgi:hypothetical protein